MGVSLDKGGNVSLTKEAGAVGLGVLTVGLGWDARSTDGAQFDLDASALILGTNGKVLSDAHFVFYGNKVSPESNVEHGGDNRTGDGDGDDEQIKIDVPNLGADVDKIVIAVSIDKAEERKQSFGQVRNAFVRCVNDNDGSELARFDLSEDASTETAMIFGEIYRNGADWKFRAVEQGYANGLRGIATDFGVNVA